MTSYLIKNGAMPFTGAEICAELGIDPGQFAVDLDVLIAVECCNSMNPVTKSVWWVSVGPSFDRESLRGNVKPTTIGEPFTYGAQMVRECTYEPRDWAVAIVRKAVIVKARASEDVNLWRAISEADERKRGEAHVNLKSQLETSLQVA